MQVAPLAVEAGSGLRCKFWNWTRQMCNGTSSPEEYRMPHKTNWILSWRRVYWLHHSPRGSLVTENARQLRIHSNSQQKPCGRRGVSHWSTEVAEYKSNRHTTGYQGPQTQVLKPVYVTDWIGEQDNPRTTVQCSSPSRNPSQHHQSPRSTPFHPFIVQLKIWHKGPRPRAHWYMCTD